MTTITLPIYNTEGKEINTMNLDSGVFGDSVNEAVLYQVVNAYRANQRQGLAQTKTRGEVSGGGRKPWKQKGTGRARVGSTRSPLWRHGGVVFGPHPRDFSYTVPKKIKILALKTAIYAKIKENNLIILDSLKIESCKTKETVKIFSRLKINPSLGALLLVDKIDDNLKFALRNIGFLTVNRAVDANTYEILAHQKLIITESAIKALTERLKKK
jgi:large subunit ribosomal protein L4